MDFKSFLIGLLIALILFIIVGFKDSNNDVGRYTYHNLSSPGTFGFFDSKEGAMTVFSPKTEGTEPGIYFNKIGIDGKLTKSTKIVEE